MESLPVYSGKARAEVKWIRDYIQVKWDTENTQTSLLPSSEINIKPELLSDLRHFLEKVEKELYHQRQQIGDKDKQIRNLKDQLLMQGIVLPEEISLLIQQIEQNLLTIKSSLLSAKHEEGEQIESASIQTDISSNLDSVIQSLMQLKEILNIK